MVPTYYKWLKFNEMYSSLINYNTKIKKNTNSIISAPSWTVKLLEYLAT